MGPAPAIDRIGVGSDQGAQQPREQAPQNPADKPDRRGRYPGAGGRGPVERPEVGIVPLQGVGREARDDHDQYHRGVGPPLEALGQFLDREHHPRDRRIERRRHPGGAPGDDDGPTSRAALQAAGQGPQDSGRHLHGRPFAPDRSAAKKHEGRNDHLPCRCPERDPLTAPATAPSFFRGGDHLRDAAAGGFRSELPGEPGRDSEAGRQHEQDRPAQDSVQVGVNRHGGIAETREERRGQAAQDGDRDNPGHPPRPPQLQPGGGLNSSASRVGDAKR